jgi:hypothetical protein
MIRIFVKRQLSANSLQEVVRASMKVLIVAQQSQLLLLKTFISIDRD